MYTTGRVWLTTKVNLPSCTVAETVVLVHVAEPTIVTESTSSSVTAHARSVLEYATRPSVLIVRWLPSSKSTTTASTLEVATLMGATLASLPNGVSRV
jgi:hypothetical protein